jgi:hypothetical protein
MKKNHFSLYYAFKVKKKVTKGLPLVRTIWWIIEGTKKKQLQDENQTKKMKMKKKKKI